MTKLPKEVDAGSLAVCCAIILASFAIRLYLAQQLIPSPVGDSIVFLEPIYNYCHSNELVAHVFPVDPLGKDRFVWHGPLPAMLYHFAVPGCSLGTVFVLRILAFAAIPLSLLALVWRGLLSASVFLVTSLFCLAFYEKYQFRPDSFAMLFVVLSYCSMRMKWPLFEGGFGACAFACAPVSGGLYALIRVIVLDLPNVRETALSVAGAGCALLGIALFYPFPLHDLLIGMQANAHIITGRSDGDIFTYYVRSDFLPLWGISIIIMIVATSLRRPAYLLLLPVIWYFGIRVPPTAYNLMPVAVGTMLLGYPLMSRFWQSAAMVSLLVPAVMGLAQITLRDVLSVAAYPDSFSRTQASIDDQVAHGQHVVAAPGFAILTNPKLASVAGKAPPKPADPGVMRGSTVIVADNGTQGKCPDGTISGDHDNASMFIFKSSSSWAVRVCHMQ